MTAVEKCGARRRKTAALGVKNIWGKLLVLLSYVDFILEILLLPALRLVPAVVGIVWLPR